MQWQGLKIPVIIFALLAGLAVIFGVQFIYEKYSFQNPLQATLSNHEAVESFQVNTENKQTKISLTLKGDADLMQSYNTLLEEIASKMGQRIFYLELLDSDDADLQQVWDNSQFAVYQAIAQGSYQDMADIVKWEAELAGVEAKLSMDQQNVYIRLKKEACILDKVIAREILKTNNGIATGGGISAQGN